MPRNPRGPALAGDCNHLIHMTSFWVRHLDSEPDADGTALSREHLEGKRNDSWKFGAAT
jgi:hypothetical protein